MSKEQRIEACPWCECKPDVIDRFNISCTNCGVTMNQQPHLLLPAWNTRPSEALDEALWFIAVLGNWGRTDCPFCKNFISDGHADDCKLKSFLTKHRKEAE